MNTDQHDSKASKVSLTDSLVDLGLEWAALGVSFGTEALERSARSLALAAKTLETVSRSLHEKLERQEAAAVEVVETTAHDSVASSDERSTDDGAIDDAI